MSIYSRKLSIKLFFPTNMFIFWDIVLILQMEIMLKTVLDMSPPFNKEIFYKMSDLKQLKLNFG